MSEEELTREIELSVEDVEELRIALGVENLTQLVGRLVSINENLLTYLNIVDRRLQALEGEPVITEDLQAHISPGGSLNWERRRPAVPQNLAKFLGDTSNKLPIEEGRGNGQGSGSQ